jgi:uncharacterized phage protein (TIGR01671 family)
MSPLIRYRVWDNTKQAMFPVREMFWRDGQLAYINYWFIEGPKDQYGAAVYLPRTEVDGSKHTGVVMQYTGLKDKNGVEIYEGDFVEDAGDKTIDHWKSQIEWADTGFQLTKTHPAERDLWELYERDRLVIIGNIHENPDPLTGDQPG